MCVIGFFISAFAAAHSPTRESFAFVSNVCFCVDSLWPEIAFLACKVDHCFFLFALPPI